MFSSYGDENAELFKVFIDPPILMYPYDTFHLWFELDTWERDYAIDSMGNRHPVRMSISSTYHAAELLGLAMDNERWSMIKYIETIYFNEMKERDNKNGI